MNFRWEFFGVDVEDGYAENFTIFVNSSAETRLEINGKSDSTTPIFPCSLHFQFFKQHPFIHIFLLNYGSRIGWKNKTKSSEKIIFETAFEY
jgi:hypothetical protein